MLPTSHRTEVSVHEGLVSASGLVRLLFVLLSVPAIALAALVALLVMPWAFFLGQWPRRLPRPGGRPPRGPGAPATSGLRRSTLGRQPG